MDQVSKIVDATLSTLRFQTRDDLASLWILLAAAVGIASISKYVTTFGKMVFDLARPGTSLTTYGSKKGHWAVVTGCTSGIGREFAIQLSKAGFKLLLISRNEASLKALQAELKTDSEIHAIDFARASSSDYDSLSSTISTLASRGSPISVLINNVGVSHSMPINFWDCSDSETDSIIEINTRAQLKIAKLVLNEGKMLNSVKGGRGLILNIGSFAALTASPMLAPYAASKAFLYTWSQALGAELEKYRIDVSLINSYFVVSNLSKIRKTNFFTPTPKQFVRSVLSHLNLPCGATTSPYISTPYYSHALAQWAVDNLFTKRFWMNYTHKMHKDINRRALRKKEREAAGKIGAKTE